MAREQDIWIYKADGSAEIRTLEFGAPAPDGWSYDPAVITDPALRTSDALSGIKPAPELPEDVDGADGPPDGFEAALKSANGRVEALEAIIAAGRAENERLAAELSASEDENDAAATAHLETIKAKDDAEARAESLVTAMTALQADLDAARAAPNTAAYRLAKVEAELAAAGDTIARLQGQVQRRNDRRPS